MSVQAIIDHDRFEMAFVPDIAQGKGIGQNIVNLMGSYQTKKLDMKGMGGNAQANDVSLLTMLGNTKTLMMMGSGLSYEDIFTQDQQMKLDIATAFGSDVTQMNDFIAEIMHSLGDESSLSPEQKDQLLELVNEIITLKTLTKMDGSMADNQARLEELIAQTAEKIADLMVDVMDNNIASLAIADFVQTMLKDVHQKYDIPSLDDKIAKIEGRMNPEHYLDQSIGEIIAQLTDILDNQDDLSDEAKAEIEALIEELQTAQSDQIAIPQSVMDRLDQLGDNFPDIVMPAEFAAHIATLQDASEVVTRMSVIEGAEMRADLSATDRSPAQDSKIAQILDMALGDVAKPAPMMQSTAIHSLMPSMPAPANTSWEPSPSSPTPSSSSTIISNTPVSVTPVTPDTPIVADEPSSPPAPETPDTGGQAGHDDPSTPKPEDKGVDGDDTPPTNPDNLVETPDDTPAPVKDPIDPPITPAEEDKTPPIPPSNKPDGIPTDFKPSSGGGGHVHGAGCGCDDAFNAAAKPGIEIEIVIPGNGPDPVKIEVEQSKWDDILAKHDGDTEKAKHYIAEEMKVENENINRFTPTRDAPDFSAPDKQKIILERMQQMKPKTEIGKDGISGPFHVCGSGCNHGHGGDGHTGGKGHDEKPKISKELDTSQLKRPTGRARRTRQPSNKPQ